eukprot:scaffold9158_cov72-Cylindrotheca_fusiformis.AAC.1
MSEPFTFPEFVGDTPLDPPSTDPTTPAGASQSSFVTAHSGGGLKDLVLVTVGSDVCCGYVGSGHDKICLRSKSECSVSKHKSSYFVFGADTLLVRDGPHRGLVDLRMEKISLTEEAVRKMMALTMTIPDWEHFFQGLEVMEEDFQPIDLPQIEELLKNPKPSSQSGPDPVLQQTVSVSSRGQQRDTSGSDPSPSDAGGPSSGSHFSFEDVDLFQPSVSDDIPQRVKAMEDHLLSAGNGLTKEVSEVANQVAISRSVLDNVVRTLGTTLDARNIADVDKKSIWEILNELQGSVKTLEQANSVLETKVATDLPSTVTSLAKSHQDAWTKFGEAFRSIRAQDDAVVKDLRSKVTALEIQMATMSQAQPASVPQPSANQFSTMFNVGPLGGTGALAHQPVASAPAVTTTTTGGSAVSASQMNTKLSGLENAMVQMRTQIKDLELATIQKNGGAVRFGSLGFKNEKDAAAFVLAHRDAGALQVGFLFDIYLLCNLIFRMANGDPDFLKTTETINKLDLKSNRAAQALLAFRGPVPDLFVDQAKSDDIWAITAKDTSYFNRVKSLAEWKRLRVKIRRDASTVETATKQRLQSAYPDATHIRMLYENSITESIACLGDLIEFMDSIISDMAHVGMSEARGFALATRLGDAFFRECHKVRAAVADDLEAKDSFKLATTIWYAVSRTLDVMSDFRRQNFREHAAINSEYVQFMVQTIVRDEASEDVITRLLELEEQAKNWEKIDKAAKDAKKTADGMKSKLDGVIAKVAGAAKEAKDAAKGVDTLKSKLSEKGVL